jgi:hypothetical protein
LAIHDLNEEGLLPPGDHAASLEEFHESFVTHDRFAGSIDEREHLFAQLCRHRAAVKEVVVIREQWIGGSLTAARPGVPTDCDVLYKLDRSDVDGLTPGAKAILDYLFDETAAHSYFQVHPFLELLPRVLSSSGVITGDLEILFDRTKDGRPCGKVVVASDE